MDVPQELKRRPQWLVWTGNKYPIDAKTGMDGSSTNPETWADFETACSIDEAHLGFAFAENDLLFGLDLDGCISPDGELQEWAQKIVDHFGTYTEVSPSGTGIKMFGIGVPPRTGNAKHPIIKNYPRVAPKKPGIELYNWGRYFCFTGEHFAGTPTELKECQDELDALCKWGWPPEPAPIPYVEPPDLDSVDRRAAAYLLAIPPAVAGQGGHNQTFDAAQAIVRGFGLSPERAYPLFAQWNQVCQPPWSEKDLRRKLEQAATKSNLPTGYLLAHDTPTTWNDVNLQHILAQANDRPEPNPEPEQTPEPEPEPDVNLAGILNYKAPPPSDDLFPADCLSVPGLIQEIVDYNLRTAMYPQPEMALAGAIALMATITGRKVRDNRGTRTNAYVLALAPSGSGKEHARKINKNILLHAGAERMVGPERIASSAGLVSFVADQPAILFQLDEIGRLITTMQNPAKAPHLYNIGTVLMQLYSSSDSLWVSDAYADAKKTKRINQPHACIYGTSVPGGFWESLSSENIADGMLGRLMVFEARTSYVAMQHVEPEPIPESIVLSVRQWLEMKTGAGNLNDQNPTPIVATYTAEAQARLTSHFAGIHQKRMTESETTAAVWSRSGEKTAKLALLFGCSKMTAIPPVIDLQDVDRAIKISNWLTRRMLQKAAEHISENETESRSKRVLRILEKPLSMNELTRKTQWLRSRERAEILGDLVSAGYILIEQQGTATKPATIVKRCRDVS